MASIFGNDWTAPFNAVAGGTFNVLALIVVVAITYKFVGNEGCDASMASILALSTLLILMPPSLVTENGQLVGDIIPKKVFIEGHDKHNELLQKEASGEGNVVNLLILHAEDQLMSAEGFKIIAQEFIDVYRKINVK